MNNDRELGGGGLVTKLGSDRWVQQYLLSSNHLAPKQFWVKNLMSPEGDLVTALILILKGSSSRLSSSKTVLTFFAISQALRFGKG